MKNSSKKLISIFSSLLMSSPLLHTAVKASNPMLATANNSKLEEIRVKRVNKKGKLVVKFCKKMKDYKGYVKVSDKKFTISEATIVKPRKIVWLDTKISKKDTKDINTDNLLARYFDDKDSSEPLKVLDEGDCPAGVLPLIIIGAGIVAGAGGSGGSGSTSSN